MSNWQDLRSIIACSSITSGASGDAWKLWSNSSRKARAASYSPFWNIDHEASKSASGKRSESVGTRK